MQSVYLEDFGGGHSSVLDASLISTNQGVIVENCDLASKKLLSAKLHTVEEAASGYLVPYWFRGDLIKRYFPSKTEAVFDSNKLYYIENEEVKYTFHEAGGGTSNHDMVEQNPSKLCAANVNFTTSKCSDGVIQQLAVLVAESGVKTVSTTTPLIKFAVLLNSTKRKYYDSDTELLLNDDPHRGSHTRITMYADDEIVFNESIEHSAHYNAFDGDVATNSKTTEAMYYNEIAIPLAVGKHELYIAIGESDGAYKTKIYELEVLEDSNSYYQMQNVKHGYADFAYLDGTATATFTVPFTDTDTLNVYSNGRLVSPAAWSITGAQMSIGGPGFLDSTAPTDGEVYELTIAKVKANGTEELSMFKQYVVDYDDTLTVDLPSGATTEPGTGISLAAANIANTGNSYSVSSFPLGRLAKYDNDMTAGGWAGIYDMSFELKIATAYYTVQLPTREYSWNGTQIKIAFNKPKLEFMLGQPASDIDICSTSNMLEGGETDEYNSVLDYNYTTYGSSGYCSNICTNSAVNSSDVQARIFNATLTDKEPDVNYPDEDNEAPKYGIVSYALVLQNPVTTVKSAPVEVLEFHSYEDTVELTMSNVPTDKDILLYRRGAKTESGVKNASYQLLTKITSTGVADYSFTDDIETSQLTEILTTSSVVESFGTMKFSYLSKDKQRLFLVSDNKVLFSSAGDFTKFETLNYLTLSSDITGIIATSYGQVVFTASGEIYNINIGQDGYPVVEQLAANIPLASATTLAIVNDNVFFLGYEGIFLLNQTNVKNLTKDMINKEELDFPVLADGSDMSATVLYDTYYLANHTQQSLWSLDLEKGRAIKYTSLPLAVKNIVAIQAQLYSSSDTELVSLFTLANLDSLRFKTGNLVAPFYDIEKEFVDLSLVYKGIFTITIYIDDIVINVVSLNSATLASERFYFASDNNKGIELSMLIEGVGIVKSLRINFEEVNRG